jgi:hypothetical protein
VEAVESFVREQLSMTRKRKVVIQFHPRIYEGKVFLGTIEDSFEKVNIYYDLNKNRCWRRFINTKELCQLLYDSPDDAHLTSSPEQIESLLRQILAGLNNVDLINNHAASSEEVTVFYAIEILLPHSERGNVEQMLADGRSPREIASKYLVPEVMVNLYLAQHYKDVMSRAYAEFRDQHQDD